jgi:hypothetical protein
VLARKKKSITFVIPSIEGETISLPIAIGRLTVVSG